MEEFHYSLELTVHDSSHKYQRVYARGISVLQMNFTDSISFQIIRYKLDGFWYHHIKLTRTFLRFQDKIRKWLLIKKKALTFLRKREVGLAISNTLLTIND